MLSLILLLAVQPPQSEQAFLRSCDMTDAGWVCRYTIPAVSAVPAPANGAGPVGGTALDPVTPPRADAGPPAVVVAPDPLAEEEARLILRCADASWLSLCLPGERRRARALKEAALARDARRLEVTRLLSENRCEDAVRTALLGGDLNLAREARAFCAAPGAVGN